MEPPERLLELREDLITAVLGQDKVIVSLNVGKKLVLVGRHAEEVALFSHLLERQAGRRILVIGKLCIILSDKCLLANIVPV